MGSSYGIGKGGRDRVSIFTMHNMLHFNQEGQADKYRSFTFVIQKLIERPMLYKGRKFDIRMWGLINANDSRCYLYEEGYVRTSSQIYTYDPSIQSNDLLFMQLTNNAV